MLSGFRRTLARGAVVLVLVVAALPAVASAAGADPDGTTPLHWAARNDNVDEARRLLKAGANVNAANRYGVTPIQLAATNGSARMLKVLIDAGANPRSANPSGETALMTAARSGVVEAVTLLLARGADVNAKEREYGETALMWAAAENHPGVVKVLAASGADLNAKATVLEFPKVRVDFATMVPTAMPRGGLTPLLYAAREGAIEAALALADAGANLNATDPDGTSPVVMAVINAHFELAAKLAARGADLSVADASGMAPLYAAVDMHTLDPFVNRPAPRPTGSIDVVELIGTLLSLKADANAALNAPLLGRQHNTGDPQLGAGATPLMRAAKSGDLAVMRLLIQHGADLNRVTRAGMTSLVFAFGPGRGKTPQVVADAVTLCLDSGADVNAANDRGETPLHLAVAQGPAVVSLLLERGARVDARDKQGRTPLDVALAPAGEGRGGRGGGSSENRERTVALLRQFADRK